MCLLNENSLSGEQQIFLKDIISILDNKNEITMSYGDIEFVVDPHGNNIEVYSNGETIAFYSDATDFLFNHKINEKSVIELSSKIDYFI